MHKTTEGAFASVVDRPYSALLSLCMNTLESLRNAVRNIPDFPKPGIQFKDITPILSDGALFRSTIQSMAECAKELGASKIVGIDARGFLFGAAVAYELGLGFVPVRKKGKLPFHTESIAYALEYGEAEVEMHADALHPGERVVLIDDLLATGGTASAALQLIEKLGAVVGGAIFLIELSFLGGRKHFDTIPVKSFISYDIE